MKQTPRQRLVWTALLLTLAATLWTAWHDEQDDAVQVAITRPQAAILPAERTRAADIKVAGAPALDLRQLQRSPWQEGGDNLFSSATIVAQADTTPAPIVQQAMEVPPFPFSYAGKLEDQGQYTVFLSMGDKNISVKTGDTVGDWKVKDITANRMILSYQPLRADVPLMIGEHH